MKKMQNMLMIVLSIAVAFSCEVVDVEVKDHEKEQQDTVQIALKDVAWLRYLCRICMSERYMVLSDHLQVTDTMKNIR